MVLRPTCGVGDYSVFDVGKAGDSLVDVIVEGDRHMWASVCRHDFKTSLDDVDGSIDEECFECVQPVHSEIKDLIV